MSAVSAVLYQGPWVSHLSESIAQSIEANSKPATTTNSNSTSTSTSTSSSEQSPIGGTGTDTSTENTPGASTSSEQVIAGHLTGEQE